MQSPRLIAGVSAAMLFLTGCPRTVTVAGAYFPAWLVCGTSSLVLSSILHLILFRSGLDPWLRPRRITYPAMVVFFTLLFYLIFFRQ
jgi:hypothetical protein